MADGALLPLVDRQLWQLARRMARDWRRTGWSVEDWHQEAVALFLEALPGYDANKGALTTFAYHRVYGGLRHTADRLARHLKPTVKECLTVRRSLLDDVDDAVLHLPEPLQRAVVHRYGLGSASACGWRELGKTLGVSPFAARRLTMLAHEKLKGLLCGP